MHFKLSLFIPQHSRHDYLTHTSNPDSYQQIASLPQTSTCYFTIYQQD